MRVAVVSLACAGAVCQRSQVQHDDMIRFGGACMSLSKCSHVKCVGCSSATTAVVQYVGCIA